MGQVLAVIAHEVVGKQSAAADLIGESQASWSRLFKGKRCLTEAKLANALTKLGISRDDFNRRLACYSPQSLPKGRICWLVPPKRATGWILGVDDVLSLAGIATEALMLPTNIPGPMRGANSENGSALAQRVRSAWGLGACAPIADLSLTFGSRAVVLLSANVTEPGVGRLKLKKRTLEVIVVPQNSPLEEQRWNGSRMFAVLRRRSLDVPSESFLQDFAREFLLPKTAVLMLLRPFIKLPDPHTVASIATTILSQHFGAPFDEVAKMVAAELSLTKSPERVQITSSSSGSNPWLTLLRAADLGAKSDASGSR